MGGVVGVPPEGVDVMKEVGVVNSTPEGETEGLREPPPLPPPPEVALVETVGEAGGVEIPVEVEKGEVPGELVRVGPARAVTPGVVLDVGAAREALILGETLSLVETLPDPEGVGAKVSTWTLVAVGTPEPPALGVISPGVGVGGRVPGEVPEAIEVRVPPGLKGEDGVRVASPLWVGVAPTLLPAVEVGVLLENQALPVPPGERDNPGTLLCDAMAEVLATPLLPVGCEVAAGFSVGPGEPEGPPGEALGTRVLFAEVEGEGVEESFDPCAEREREGEAEEEGEVEEHLDTKGERVPLALNVS